MFEPVPYEAFAERTGINRKDYYQFLDGVGEVVALRDLRKVELVCAMPFAYLEQLIRSIPLRGDIKEKPFANCQIRLERSDPHGLLLGQTFIQRGKYQALLENFSKLFDGHCVTRGVAKCNAHILRGWSQRGQMAIAHYVPPIIEENGQRILLDGVHRNFLIKQVGTTLESIVIRGLTPAFPCDPQEWENVKVVEEKPPLAERYFNLQPDLFRLLHYVGIDG